MRITVYADGPYLVTGEVEITDASGRVARRATKVALCRCGHSATKPFCDGSHRTSGFTDPGPVGAAAAGPGQTDGPTEASRSAGSQ